VGPVTGEYRAQLTRDPRGVALDEKLKLVQSYNDILLGAGAAIESTRVGYNDSFRAVHFANTRGSYYYDERPRIICYVSATARDGENTQRGFDSVSSPDDYGVVEGLEERTREVAQRAVDLLTAPKVEGGSYDVILDPYMAGVFVHEAFGHLSEADFLYENPKMRELMHLGRQVGVKELDVVDDGTLPRRDGTHPFDDEGTPTQATPLITGGMLSGHLHSLETAAKMDARPTGNARAIGRSHRPIVRMTNTYIANGDTPVEELFAGVDRGIYACRAFGGQTMLEMFTFSAAYAYRIENGTKGELVRDVVLSGNVFETLMAIDAMGDDFIICEGAGGCGKGGQMPLPVSFGSPHIRIRNVVIGGR
jgi:TldD protein